MIVASVSAHAMTNSQVGCWYLRTTSHAPPPTTTVETTKSATPSSMRPKADELLRSRASWPSAQSSTAELKIKAPPPGKGRGKREKRAAPAAKPKMIEPNVTAFGDTGVGSRVRA